MFLNTTYSDFGCYKSKGIATVEQPVSEPAPTSLHSMPPILESIDSHDSGSSHQSEVHLPGEDLDQYLYPKSAHASSPWTTSDPFRLSVVYSLSPFALGDTETYLLDYFTNGLVPRCTTWPAENPFLRTIIPICLSALNEPLFNTIMAVACH